MVRGHNIRFKLKSAKFDLLIFDALLPSLMLYHYRKDLANRQLRLKGVA